MFKFFTKISLLALLPASLSFAANVITNGSFETGDFTGWTASTNLVGRDSLVIVPQSDSYSPVGGKFFAAIPGGCQSNYLRQTFTATAGDQLQLWVYFEAKDTMPFNDNGSLDIELPNNNDVNLFIGNVSGGSTAWQYVTFTFPVSGSYSLVATSSNQGDCNFPSILGLDQVSYVATSLGSGGVGSGNGTVLPDQPDRMMIFPQTTASNMMPSGTTVTLSNTDLGLNATFQISSVSDFIVPSQEVFGSSTFYPNDAALYYNGYALKGSSGTRARVQYSNEFESSGSQQLETAPFLMVPGVIGSGIVNGLGTIPAASFYLCYNLGSSDSFEFQDKCPVKGDAHTDSRHGIKHPGTRQTHATANVTLTNSYITNQAYGLAKPVLFCAPVDVSLKNTDGSVATYQSNMSAQDNLVCYGIPQAVHTSATSQVMSDVFQNYIDSPIQFSAEQSFCTPSTLLKVQSGHDGSEHEPSHGDNDQDTKHKGGHGNKNDDDHKGGDGNKGDDGHNNDGDGNKGGDHDGRDND